MKTTVLPGGRIEIVNPELRAGEAVEVVVRHSIEAKQLSALQILKHPPRQRMFNTSDPDFKRIDELPVVALNDLI